MIVDWTIECGVENVAKISFKLSMSNVYDLMKEQRMCKKKGTLKGNVIFKWM